MYWLVVWNIFYFSIIYGIIFPIEGVETTNVKAPGLDVYGRRRGAATSGVQERNSVWNIRRCINKKQATRGDFMISWIEDGDQHTYDGDQYPTKLDKKWGFDMILMGFKVLLNRIFHGSNMGIFSGISRKGFMRR